MTIDPGRAAPRGPLARRVVAGLVLAEAIVVAAYGFVLAIDTLLARPASVAGSASLALLVVLLGVGIGVVAVAVGQGRRWSRAPALVWQALQLAATLPALGAGRAVAPAFLLLAGALVVAAVVVIRGLFLPGVVEDEPGPVG